MTVTTLKEIPAGDEVINYYGPLSNGELLRRYGYVTPKHAAYDVVELSWDLVLSAIKDNLELDDATWGKAVSTGFILPLATPIQRNLAHD